MLGNFANLLVWLLVAAWIVVSGWDEPLKYRFMTTDRVKAEELPLHPTPVPAPDYRTWSRPSSGSTTLGHSPINEHGVKNTPFPRRGH